MATVLSHAPLRRAPPLPPSEKTKRGARSWLEAPSWLLSLVMHVGLLVTLAVMVERPVGFGKRGGFDNEIGIFAGLGTGTGTGLPGNGTGQPEGESIGIYSGPASDAAADGPAGRTGDKDTESTGASAAAGPSVPRADDGPPVDLELPAAPAFAAVGTGPGPFGDSRGDAREMIRSTGRGQSGTGRGSGGGGTPGDGRGGGGGGDGGEGGGGGGGGGGTSFFGHRAGGNRFVYVLDASGSMYDYNAIAVAKAELLASLEQLDATQQFQIIFYNEQCHPMPNAEGKEGLFWGTDTNRTRASQFIRSIQPDGGTRHLDALLKAIGYGADVIFFLTDAGEPILYPADLEKIKRRNNGRTRIFTVEFGKGPNLKTDNYLKKLARDNGGSAAYRDVQEFRKKGP